VFNIVHGFDNIPTKQPSEREDRSFFLMQKYESLDEMPKVQSCSASLSRVEYRYVTDDVKEVIVTDSLEWVSKNIDGIAFVFHVDSIKNLEEWIFCDLCECIILIFPKESDEWDTMVMLQSFGVEEYGQVC
jgi:hypothetical protein